MKINHHDWKRKEKISLANDFHAYLFSGLTLQALTLQTIKRFKSVTGRTVYAEIMRVRLERVQTLLRETPMTIEAIADTCGFASASHLSMVHKKHFNMTLSSCRCQTRV